MNHILSTKNEDETHALGQDKLNSATTTQRTPNQLPSPATQHDHTQNEKVKCQWSIRREQHKPEKGWCPTRRRQNKEEENQYDQGTEMGG